jgi:hypothetical protein
MIASTIVSNLQDLLWSVFGLQFSQLSFYSKWPLAYGLSFAVKGCFDHWQSSLIDDAPLDGFVLPEYLAFCTKAIKYPSHISPNSQILAKILPVLLVLVPPCLPFPRLAKIVVAVLFVAAHAVERNLFV